MPIRTLFRKSSQFVLDFVLPPHCVNCKAANHWLCKSCLRQISLITGPVCTRCGIPVTTATPAPCHRCQKNFLQTIDGIRAAAHFGNTPLRRAIHDLKYHNHRAVATELGKLLVEAFHHYHLQATVIVPVPLHPHRQKERGFNQSELLTHAISATLNLPVECNTLQRIRHTKVQVHLSASERQQNVANAFTAIDQRLQGSQVLLIDDVCTTGATLDACATALYKSGVSSVWGLTLARATVGEA